MLEREEKSATWLSAHSKGNSNSYHTAELQGHCYLRGQSRELERDVHRLTSNRVGPLRRETRERAFGETMFEESEGPEQAFVGRSLDDLVSGN